MKHYPVVDPRPELTRPCCILCFTWTCGKLYCQYRVPRANPEYAYHRCLRCGNQEGRFEATRHYNPNVHYNQLAPRLPYSVIPLPASTRRN